MIILNFPVKVSKYGQSKISLIDFTEKNCCPHVENIEIFF